MVGVIVTVKDDLDKLIYDWNSQDKTSNLLTVLRIIESCQQGEKVVITKNRQLVKRLQQCQADTKEIRTLSYKVLEALVSPVFNRQIFESYHFDVFVIRTLMRDSRYDLERQQVMKLLYKYVDQPDGPDSFPMSVLRAVVALAEQPDDNLRNSAIELICELALRNPASVSFSCGLRAVFTSVLEGPLELLKPVIRTYIYLLDTKSTRVFIRPHLELEVVISQFTDAYTMNCAQPGSFSLDKLQIAAAVIQEVLGSWTGLLFFCVGDRLAINAVIDALSLPNEEITNVLLQLLQSLIGCMKQVEAHEWAVQFQAITLMIFIECGILEALIAIIKVGNPSSSDYAFTLLADILTICAKRLPQSYNENVQALPLLFSPAIDFKNEPTRQITRDKLVKIFESHQHSISKDDFGKISLLVTMDDFGLDTLGLTLDDYRFHQAISISQVTGIGLVIPSGKDYALWNWESICDIMKGSFLNPRRFDELVRNSKFALRMVHFIKPSSKQFSDTPQDAQSSKIVWACSKFICTLASTTVGYKFLQETRLVAEIVERIAKIGDPASFDPSDTSFTKEKIDSLLAKDYFTILGDLQKSGDERIFEELSIWNVYYSLVELRGKDYILKYILTTGFYETDGHMRIIFSKLLTSGYKEMRLYTTNFILTLLERNTPGLEDWIPEMLVTQLFDPAPAVSAVALAIIKESPKYPAFMRKLIIFKPEVEYLSSVDSQTLIKFAQTIEGFQYLLECGFIQKEAKYWVDCGIYQYVMATDIYLNSDTVFNGDEIVPQFPLHFFGCLAQTEEGCQFIEKIDDVEMMCKYLSSPMDLQTSLMKTKSSIWTIAHIGSSDFGYTLLKGLCGDKHILQTIVEIISDASIFSIRGVCLYSLCIFSKSAMARELLGSLGWYTDKGVCVPFSSESLFKIQPWTFEGSWPAKRMFTFSPISHSSTPDQLDLEILKAIGNLSNHIVASANSKKLTGLKQTNPSNFTSVKLFIQAIRLTSNYQFRVPPRRFVMDLFDKVVWDEDNIKILEKCKGLNFIVPIVYAPLPYIPSVMDLYDKEDEKEAVVFDKTPKSSFSPNRKIMKGF